MSTVTGKPYLFRFEQTSDRAKELLSKIGKKKDVPVSVVDQLTNWIHKNFIEEAPKQLVLAKIDNIANEIKLGNIEGFAVTKGVLEIDIVSVFGTEFVEDGSLYIHLMQADKQRQERLNGTKEHSGETIKTSVITVIEKGRKRAMKKAPVVGQLAFDIF